MAVNDTETTRTRVRDYYGRTLSSSADLQTNACCTAETLPPRHQEILAQIDGEVLSRFYGCGSPIPPDIEGRVILDLGCGTGRDVFLAACLAGPDGRVIGVDMTDEQLEVARRHAAGQMDVFGLPTEAVDFRWGYIEDLAAAGIDDATVDVVISNCVINLSPDKGRVFREILRVLKPGGELFFSDVFADRRVPRALRDDAELYGECLSGAMYVEDFRRLLREVGCLDFRVVKSVPVQLGNPRISARIGNIRFRSLTIRLFKLEGLEDRCEDYGQTAVYHGTLDEHPYAFDLDNHHHFVTGKPMLVCGNTAAMVGETRLARHFTVTGNRLVHYGLFPDCEGAAPADGACC